MTPRDVAIWGGVIFIKAVLNSILWFVDLRLATFNVIQILYYLNCSNHLRHLFLHSKLIVCESLYSYYRWNPVDHSSAGISRKLSRYRTWQFFPQDIYRWLLFFNTSSVPWWASNTHRSLFRPWANLESIFT